MAKGEYCRNYDKAIIDIQDFFWMKKNTMNEINAGLQRTGAMIENLCKNVEPHVMTSTEDNQQSQARLYLTVISDITSWGKIRIEFPVA